MNYVVCEHDLTHRYAKHECDGCCAQYVLQPLEEDGGYDVFSPKES
jgi:hypothetical protein